MRLALPEDPQAREKAWDLLVADAEKQRNLAAPEWYIVLHYLKGCRFFETIDYAQGIVRPSYETVTDGIPFRYEGVLKKYNNEVSRLLKLDTAPSVTRNTVGLDQLRKRSTCQAVLDHIYPVWNPKKTYAYICQALVAYGTVGLLAYDKPTDEKVFGDPASGIGMEVVLPWELLGFPGNIKHPSEVQAIGRVRWVPYRWVKDYFGDEVKKRWPVDDDKMELRMLPVGSSGSAVTTPISSEGINSEQGKKTKTKTAKDTEPFVKMVEVWSPYSNGRLADHYVRLGRWEAIHTPYKNNSKAPMMPIGLARNTEGLGFYGRSFVYPLIPLEHHMEPAILNMIRNVADFDQFGMIGMPENWGVNLDDLRTNQPGPKLFTYSPDPTMPHHNLQSVLPVNSGRLQVGVLYMLMGLTETIAQQPEAITQGKAPGRVDSAVGMDYLFKASNIPLGAVAASIGELFSTVFKASLGFAKSWPAITLNLDSLTDDALLGIKINPETGEMLLRDNKLPDPIEMSIGIASEKLKDPLQMEQKLFGLLQATVISPEQFRIQSRLEGLDLGLGNDAEWQNYRMAILRNIILFNDGETPGRLTQSQTDADWDMPQIHLMVLTRLMASPEFSLASPDVQKAFEELRERYVSRSATLPEGMPNMEDAAEMTAEEGSPPGMGEGMPT